MSIEEIVARFEHLLPADELTCRLQPTLDWVEEDPIEVVPSFELGQDGRYLASLYLIWKDTLCEVRLNEQGVHFDFVSRDQLEGIRIKIVKASVGDEPNIRTYKSVTVTLQHFGLGRSDMSYVGDDPTAWLECVRKMFPLRSFCREP